MLGITRNIFLPSSMFRNPLKRFCILTMLAGSKKVCERLAARTRLAVLAPSLVFTISLGNFNQVCGKQTFHTGTLGSRPAWTQLAVLARDRFPNKHQFKHTSFQKDQLCTNTFFCVLNKTWTRSKLHFFSSTPGREDMPHSLMQERHYFLPLAACDANALFSKELGALINSSFNSLSSLLEILLSPRPRRSLTLLACGRQLRHT